MKKSTEKTSDTTSKRIEIGQIGIKNRLQIIAAGALLLAATSPMAGLLSSPLGVLYANPKLASVDTQNIGNGKVQIRTTGLTGEMTLQGRDFPPEYDIATTAKVVLPFDQELELTIDLDEGTVSGHASMDKASAKLAAIADVRGSATCLPLNGLECGQLVVDLELRGVMTDPNDPTIVGQLRMEMLGSLYFDGSDVGLGHWAAMSANATIGGNEELINSLSWSEGDFNLDGS